LWWALSPGGSKREGKWRLAHEGLLKVAPHLGDVKICGRRRGDLILKELALDEVSGGASCDRRFFRNFIEH
jgi:hypothetical protein